MITEHEKNVAAAGRFRQGDIVTFKYHDFHKQTLAKTGLGLDRGYGIVATSNHILCREPGNSVTLFPIADKAAGLGAIAKLSTLEDIDLLALDYNLPAQKCLGVAAGRFIRPDMALTIGPHYAAMRKEDAVLPKALLAYSLDQFARLLIPEPQPQEIWLAETSYTICSTTDKSPVVPLLPAELTRETKSELVTRTYSNKKAMHEKNIKVVAFQKDGFIRGDLNIANYDSLHRCTRGQPNSFATVEKMWEIRSYLLSHLGQAPHPHTVDMRAYMAQERKRLSTPPRPLAQLAKSLHAAAVPA